MKKTKIFADANLAVGQVEPELYGSFIEHLGRAVYGGIYEPGHPTADADGFRGDVLELIRQMNVPVVRYPGGNFVSGYNWRDGVGPKDKRPKRLDLAWYSTETNQFGTDEFVKWCRKAGIEPMLAVNMGTGSIKDAADLVEYCNHPGGTELSEMRRANGADKPHNVRYWCIGNEMDGGWQIGHLSAEDYGKKALEAAKVMRWTNGEATVVNFPPKQDPLKLVVCGSSGPSRSTYPEWDRIALEYTYNWVDYISMHRYFHYDPDKPDALRSFLGSAADMDAFIQTVRATIEYVRAKERTRKQVYISFDEWNVWSSKTPRTEPLWKEAPAIEQTVYTFLDVLVFAGMMNTLVNNCDVVKVAALAQLVNALSPLLSENGGGVIRQTTFYPFCFISNNMRGKTLRTLSESDTFDTVKGPAEFIHHAINYNEKTRTVAVSLCNYDESAREVELELRSFERLVPVSYVEMANNDLMATNTFAHPDAVKPAEKALPAVQDGSRVTLTLPALSWSFLTFRC